LNGKPEGKGKVYYATGNYLEGEFHEGHPCGIVRIFYTDGSYFEGQIVDYVPSGTGKYITDHFEF
jgi:antitoxin component YwqK of YwqJK toxin-antitoxin module